jgi:hypothetical protein
VEHLISDRLKTFSSSQWSDESSHILWTPLLWILRLHIPIVSLTTETVRSLQKVVTHLLSELLLTRRRMCFLWYSKATLAAFQASQKDSKGPCHPSVLHPWHPSVKSYREVILLCTEGQRHVLTLFLLFCLTRSMSSAFGIRLGPKLPVQKVYEARVCPVQKISTSHKSTFSRLHDARHPGISCVYRVNVGPGTKKMQFLPTKHTLWISKRDERGWEEARHNCHEEGVAAARSVWPCRPRSPLQNGTFWRASVASWGSGRGYSE